MGPVLSHHRGASRPVTISGRQAGLALLPWLILVAVLVASPILVPAVQDMVDLATGKWNPKEKPPPLPTEADIPFIGPGLPEDTTKADCVKKEADKVGLYWTSKGWRTNDVDPPSLNGDPARVRAAIDFYRRRMEAYVGSRQKEWESCLKDLPPPVQQASTTEPQLDFRGTYALTYQPSPSSCQFSGPSTVAVSGTPEALTITATEPGLTVTMTGSVDRSGSFSANADISGLGRRMLGRFDGSGSAVKIQNGSLAYTGADPCTLDFTGVKQ